MASPALAGQKIPKVDFSHLLLKSDVKGRTSNCFCSRAYKGAQVQAKREGHSHAMSIVVAKAAWAKATAVYKKHGNSK